MVLQPSSRKHHHQKSSILTTTSRMLQTFTKAQWKDRIDPTTYVGMQTSSCKHDERTSSGRARSAMNISFTLMTEPRNHHLETGCALQTCDDLHDDSETQIIPHPNLNAGGDVVGLNLTQHHN